MSQIEGKQQQEEVKKERYIRDASILNQGINLLNENDGEEDPKKDAIQKQAEAHSKYDNAFKQSKTIYISGVPVQIASVEDIGRNMEITDLVKKITVKDPKAMIIICMDERFIEAAVKIVMEQLGTDKICFFHRAGLGALIIGNDSAIMDTQFYNTYVESIAGRIEAKDTLDHVYIISHPKCAAVQNNNALANEYGVKLYESLNKELKRRAAEKLGKEEIEEGDTHRLLELQFHIIPAEEIPDSPFENHVHDEIVEINSRKENKKKHGILSSIGFDRTFGFMPMFTTYSPSGASIGEVTLSEVINTQHGLGSKKFGITIAIDQTPEPIKIEGEETKWIVPAIGSIPEFDLSENILAIKKSLLEKFGEEKLSELEIIYRVLILE